MYLIDSNIFLEILMKQENSEDCKKLLREIAKGEMTAKVSKFTIHGVEGILTEDTDSIDKFVNNIASLVNLRIVETSLEEEKQALILSKNSKLDFDDALQCFIARRENVDALVSFDDDFDQVDIKRVEPGDLVE